MGRKIGIPQFGYVDENLNIHKIESCAAKSYYLDEVKPNKNKKETEYLQTFYECPMYDGGVFKYGVSEKANYLHQTKKLYPGLNYASITKKNGKVINSKNPIRRMFYNVFVKINNRNISNA